MSKVLAVLLLSANFAIAQAAPPQSTNPENSSKPAPAKDADKPAEVAATAPVITLHGLCPDKPAGTDSNSPDCKTVVTRAEFEHLTQTLAPNMPTAARKQLAGDYSRMLVLSDEAKKRQLDKTQRFNEILSFMKMRILAQELLGDVQEKSKPNAAEVDKYYQDNKSKYEELTLKRVFIPRNKPAAESQKPEDNKPKTDEELQAEGEKYRARLAAGEDFDKVQKEAYEASGFKTPPPPTSIPNWRHDAVPPQQQALFQLNKGDLSQVMVEPAGAYVYKVEEKTTTPLAQVKAEIETQLTNQRMQQAMESLTSSVKPEMNEAYFATSGAEDREVHALTPPASTTQPKATKAPGAASTKTVPKKAASAAPSATPKK
jgi:hypothetical protein